MYFIEFDAHGELLTRYTSDIHGDAIPKEAIEVEEGVFLQTIIENDGVWFYDSAKDMVVKRPLPKPSAEQIELQVLFYAREHLNAVARKSGFEGIADAVSFADETAVPSLQRVGAELRAWRSRVIDKALTIARSAASGSEGYPTQESVVSALPEFLG